MCLCSHNQSSRATTFSHNPSEVLAVSRHIYRAAAAFVVATAAIHLFHNNNISPSRRRQRRGNSLAPRLPLHTHSKAIELNSSFCVLRFFFIVLFLHPAVCKCVIACMFRCHHQQWIFLCSFLLPALPPKNIFL